MKTKLFLLLVVLLASAASALGQARTAERLVSVPFSQLSSGNPPDGSVRHVINGLAGSTPCAAGGTGAMAIKIDGVWNCPRLGAGAGTGDTMGAAASSVGEMVLYGDTSGKTLTRSNTLSGIPLLSSGQVSVLASSGTGNVVRTLSATLTAPTLLTPTIGSFNNAQHTHESAAGGGQLNASTVFSAGTIPPPRVITGTIINSRCLRVSNVGQIEVAAEDCGSGGGGGSPGGVSGNLVFNESGSPGGISNSAYDSVTGRLALNQKANGNDTLYSQRFTDTSPTGTFIKFRNADGSTDLFTVSVDGGVFLSSKLTWKNIAAPSVPSSGNTVVWTDLTDKNLKAQDASGNVFITLRPIACSGTDKISAILSSGVVTCTPDQGATGTGVISLNGLTSDTQSFAVTNDTNVTLSVNSSTSTHTFVLGWAGALTKIRQHGATMYSDQSNTVTTGAQSFAAATSLTLPTSAGAAPTASAQIAFDSTSNTLEAGVNGTNRIIAFTAGSQTFSDKTLDNSNAISVRDSLLTLQDNADSTKTVNFEISAITSGVNRVVTVPDANSVTVVPSTATANQFVTHIDSNGVAQRVQPSFSNLSGSIGPSQGGTGLTAVAQGDLLYGDATNSWARLGKSAAATRYLTNTGPSNNPQWDLVNVANGITGIVPADNGGTGSAFFQVSGPSASVKTYTFPNISTTVLTTAAAVTVGQGGTGLTSGNSGGIPYFSSTSTIASSNPLTANALVLGGGAGSSPTVVGSLGTTTTVLHGNTAGAPGFSQIVNADIANGTIDLTTKVTSILPGANGGTNNGFLQFSGPATSLKTFALPNASATILTDAALVTASQGGTSNAFFQVSGPATSVKTFSFPNASATVLTDNAAVTIAQGGTGQATQTAAFNALDPLTTKGDIIVHDGTNSVRQAVGTNGFALLADSTQTNGVRWGAISASAGGSTTQLQYNSAGSLAGLSTVTTDGTIVTFAAGDLKVGSIALASAPTPALGKFYVQTDDGKLYFGINGSSWGEVFVSGLSAVNLASANVTGTLPLANGGTNQTTWTASRCVQVNSAGTALESAAAACGSGSGGSPGGSGSELQFRGGASTFSAVTGSSVSGGNVTLAGSLSLTSSGAGYLELAEGAAPTVVANRLTFAAPVDAPAAGLLYILPADTPTNGEQLTANISGTTVTLSWEAGGSGGSGDMVLASVQAVTGAKTFDPAKLIVGGQSATPTAVAGAFYRDTDDTKLYWAIDNSTWGEVFVSGISTVNLASANVTGITPLANGGTNQSSWTASRCVQVNSAGTALEAASAACGSGGGSGTVTVVSSGSLTSTALVTGGGTTTLQTPSATATLDSSGNMALPGSLTLTGSGAGYTELAEGTAPSAVANRVTVAAPTDVTAAGWVMSLPTTAGSNGQFLQTNGSGVTTWATPSGSGTVTATGGSLTSNSVVLGAGSTDTKVAAGIVTDGTSKLTLGVAGTSVGSIDLKNATSGTITLAPVTGALGTVTLSIPARTATMATTTGTLTSGRCVEIDASGNFIQAAAACGSGGSGDAVSVNGTAATDANFVATTASGTVPSVTWALDTAPTPDAVSIATIGAASTTEAGVITTGTQSLAGTKLLGHTAALGRLGQTFEVTTGATFGGIALNTFSSVTAEASVLDFNRSKSATKGTQTVVAADDVLGHVTFRGSDGTNFQMAASVQGAVDGTPGTSDMPGRLTFWTTADGASTPTERWRITNVGHFLATTDNAVDIGASGATRPRSIYVATSVLTPKVVWTGSVQDNSGSGSPEGAVTAAVGSLYRRTDGGAATTLYVKESGAGNTGWVGVGAGGGGSGTINSGATNTIPKYTASTTIDDSLLSDDGTTLTYTGTGGVSAPLFASSGSGAGYLELAEGTAPTLVANRFQIFSPADVAAGGLSFILPAAGATGFLKTTNSTGTMTLSIDTTAYAPLASPSFTTPALGVATATSINGLTITTSTGTLTIANGKTVTVNNSLTFAGTDSTTMTFPTTSATIARTDAAQTFTGTQTFGAVVGTTWNGNTWATGTGTLSIAAGKTATVSNTLTFAGTDSTTMTFPGTSGTVVTADSTVTKTNLTLDVEGTGNVITTLSVIDFPAAGCNNTTASSFWDLPTSTPAVAACVSGTNTQKAYLDFADTSGGFSAQTGFRLPADFTGTVDAKITWLTTATSGNVKWSLSTICVATDATETDDPAFNAASTSTTAAPGVASRLQTSAITSLTITGCAAGEFMHVKIARDGADAADTISATARLVGVQLILRRAQ